MGRTAKPWFRKFDGWWYATVKGKRTKLVKAGPADQEKAQKKFDAIQKELDGLRRGDMLEAYKICEKYLQAVEKLKNRKEMTPETFRLYTYFLNTFTALHGRKAVYKLQRDHAYAWVDAHPSWNKSSRSYALAILKRCFRWAHEGELITRNPFWMVKKGIGPRRTRVLTTEEQTRMLEAANPAFRNFLFALFQTGARPGEIRRITKKMCHFDKGCAILEEHKTRSKTDEPRVVWLSPELIELCKELCEKHPTGPIFRNLRGTPWKRENLDQNMVRLRDLLDLGTDVVCYTARHTFATSALKTLDAGTVASIMGHRSVNTLIRNYEHLTKDSDYMRESVNRVSRPRS